jgi:hypothetical protein
MLCAKIVEAAVGRAVFNSTGEVCVRWSLGSGEFVVGGIVKSRFSGVSNSPIAWCVFATFAGREGLCVLLEDGVLELLLDLGNERFVLPTPFHVAGVFPLASGVLLQAASATPSVYSILHPLDAPCPVSRLSKSGRGDAFRPCVRIVASGGALVVLWDSETRKHAVYAAYQASDRASSQSYAKAVEESILMETAQSFYANQISLYDTFTVAADAPLVESQVFLRRLWIDSESLDRCEASAVSVSQNLLFLRTGSRLRCFDVNAASTQCRLAFEMDGIMSFAPIGLGRLWVGVRSGAGAALQLYDSDRELSAIELGLAGSVIEKRSSSVGGVSSSGMSMSMDEDDDSLVVADGSAEMECSPPVVGSNMRLTHLERLPWSFVLDGAAQQSRCMLSMFPKDPFVVEMMKLVQEVLPGTAGVDFLVDFGETAACMPGASEWDRFASLIGSLLGMPDEDQAPSVSPGSWQRVVSSSAFVARVFSLPRAKAIKYFARDFKLLPAEWKPVNFVMRTPSTLFQELSFSILQRLHLFYEGAKADADLIVQGHLLRPLLVMLASMCGADKYVLHYLCDDGSIVHLVEALKKAPWRRGSVASRAGELPFHLFRWLVSMTGGKVAPLSETWCGELPADAELRDPLRRIVELWTLRFGVASQVDEVKRAVDLQQLRALPKPALLHACELIRGDVAEIVSSKEVLPLSEVLAQCGGNLQLAMACYFGYTEGWKVEGLPPAVRWVVEEAFAVARAMTNPRWPRRLFELIGRMDMALQREQPALAHEFSNERVSWGDPERRAAEGEAGVLITNPVSYLRFPQDRRLQEAQKLLGTWPKLSVSVPQPPGMSDHDYLDVQNRVAILNVVCLGARCVGRGMLAYGADNFQTDDDPSTKWEMPVPAIPRTVRIVETRSSVSLDESGPNAGAMDWLDFHSGVASGLRIASHGGPLISNAWIVYNRPGDGAAASVVFAHAGLLLGLGLNGHLKHLTFVRLFDYLARAHVMTSMGLLLGISSTMCGTMDNAITKLLSVHLPLLHPHASADLEVPPMLQVASLMGLGLLYKGSCHRRMCEIMLVEMDRPPTEDRLFHRESHSLTAGLALGWITLGHGGDAATLGDLSLEDRLARFIDGGAKHTDATWATDGYAYQEQLSGQQNQKVRSNLVKAGSHTNTSLTAGPALLALGLMFLKTGNVDVADRIQVPETLFLLGYVRPDLLLLRCLSRSLILWDEVEPTEIWMKSHIPSYIWRYGDPETGRKDLNNEMADEMPRNRDFCLLVHCKMYCIAGCALGLGITRAGTHDPATRGLLLAWLKKLIAFRKSCAEPDVLVAENCLMVVAIAASVVMAGSGDLELTRLFRMLALRVEVAVL